MDEKRRYFRIHNDGDILANYESYSLDVVEISSSGALVIKENFFLAKEGVIEISIHNFSMKICYELLKKEKNTMVLVFTNSQEIEALFVVLKKIKDEHKH